MRIQDNENNARNLIGGFIIEVIKIVIISLAIILPVRYFLIQPFYVKGASMEPNFYDHEYLIIDEISYRFNAPERGDIVVFKYPRNPSEYFIKRIIGLPGEKVEVKDGSVYIYNSEYVNGQKLDEEYLGSDTNTFLDQTVQLKEGEYFVLGDNRESSLDSRRFGPVSEKFITGKVLLRGWPIDRLKVFDDDMGYNI